jgi:hypothetical protein
MERSPVYQAYWQAVTGNGRCPCWLAQFTDTACGGLLDAAHLIPKQRMKRAGLPEADVFDPRTGVSACRRHHNLFDNRSLRLARRDLPRVIEDWAQEHNFTWSLDRDYGGFDGQH